MRRAGQADAPPAAARQQGLRSPHPEFHRVVREADIELNFVFRRQGSVVHVCRMRGKGSEGMRARARVSCFVRLPCFSSSAALCPAAGKPQGRASVFPGAPTGYTAQTRKAMSGVARTAEAEVCVSPCAAVEQHCEGAERGGAHHVHRAAGREVREGSPDSLGETESQARAPRGGAASVGGCPPPAR